MLEFPQSGERFEGRATFTEWRSQYAVSVDDLRYRLSRITAREDFAATEMTASYDRGENWVYGVQLLDFRGDKVIRELIYVADGWEARSGARSGAQPRPPIRRPDRGSAGHASDLTTRAPGQQRTLDGLSGAPATGVWRL